MLPKIVEMAEAGSGINLISRPLGVGVEVVRYALHLHRTGHRAASTPAANRVSPASRAYPSISRSRRRSTAFGKQAKYLTRWAGNRKPAAPRSFEPTTSPTPTRQQPRPARTASQPARPTSGATNPGRPGGSPGSEAVTGAIIVRAGGPRAHRRCRHGPPYFAMAPTTQLRQPTLRISTISSASPRRASGQDGWPRPDTAAPQPGHKRQEVGLSTQRSARDTVFSFCGVSAFALPG